MIYFWNRIPHQLCKNIVERFNYVVKTTSKNDGNKENTKDRRDRKPQFKLPKYIKWKNKVFEEYSDQIERIAYSNETFERFKTLYMNFIPKAIAFYKKIIKSIEVYRNKNTGTCYKYSRNKEYNDYCSNSNTFLENLNKNLVDKKKSIQDMDEDAFWNSFPSSVKENLISNNTLSSSKIEMLIFMNDIEANRQISDIIKTVKIEFKDDENDFKEFCNKLLKINDLSTTGLTNDITGEYNYSDEENHVEITSIPVNLNEQKLRGKKKDISIFKENDEVFPFNVILNILQEERLINKKSEWNLQEVLQLIKNKSENGINSIEQLRASILADTSESFYFNVETGIIMI